MSGIFAAYHLATLADFCDVGVIFPQQHDSRISQPGVKAVRGTVVAGAARAVTNAIRHATGKRVRPTEPISLDKLPT